MLIPQTSIGIAERRRPDFVAFVPLQYWRYKWIAVQLDGAHLESQARDDWARDQYIQEHNYEVLSLRPNKRGYLGEVQKLVEAIEGWMNLADDDPWSIAIEVPVRKSVPDEPIPF